MIDATTNKPVQVEISGETSSIVLPASQLETVQKLLEGHGIHHSVRGPYISWNDGPYMAFVYLSRNADPKAAQAALDSVP